MDIDARAFGQLEGEVKSLTQMMDAQNKTLALQNEVLAGLTQKVDAMSHTLSEARGGWKTLVWIGGAAASAGGVVVWALNHLAFKA